MAKKKLIIRTNKGIWQTSYLVLTGFSLLLVLFIVLGCWQIWRAQQTQQRLQQQQQAFKQPLIALTISAIDDWQAYEFRKVSLKGKWLHDKQFLQDNVTFNGRAGYEVLTPLEVASQSVLMINHGWIPKSAFKNSPIIFDNPTKTLTVSGHLSQPLRRFSFGQDIWSINYPIIMQVMDLSRLSKQLQMSVLPYQLRLQADNPNTFQTSWTPIFGNPQKNYAYALQWFLFGCILCFLFWRLNYQKDLDHAKNH